MLCTSIFENEIEFKNHYICDLKKKPK